MKNENHSYKPDWANELKIAARTGNYPNMPERRRFETMVRAPKPKTIKINGSSLSKERIDATYDINKTTLTFALPATSGEALKY